MNRSLLLVPLLALVACADADGDGLSDAREEQLGTDPAAADTDGDTISDKDELKEGLDPTLWDTDGDGYSDFQEIDFGSDPLDVASSIYIGGWPYNPYKDDLEDPGLDGRLGNGDRLGRFTAIDQFGQEVDIYDYAGQGKYVLLDVSALWCPPCREVSKWLAGDDDQGWEDIAAVREGVQNGDILWVTVLVEDNQGNPFPSAEEIGWWDERFGSAEIATLADNAEADILDFTDPMFFPSIYLLDENLERVSGPSSQSWVPPLVVATNILEADDESTVE